MTIPNRGQHKKDGYEVLYDTFKQTQAPRKEKDNQTTESQARVVEVISKTDPNAQNHMEYFILARRIKEDKSIPEPEFYEKSYIKDENIIGLKRYYPASSELQIPNIGQLIRVSFRSTESDEGIYLGPCSNTMTKQDLVGSVNAQKGENSPSNSFDGGKK